jgi:DNA-binding transcriptional ArsR family regulator
MVHRLRTSELDFGCAICDRSVTMSSRESAHLDRLLRALADPTRRQILRLLKDRPGMTTNEVADRVSGMTRWGVMKHLATLAEAGLVQTLPDGRRRRHFREAAALEPLGDWLAGATE